LAPAKTTEELIDLDKHLLEHCDRLKSDADFNKVMALLYASCFKEFNQAWCNSRPTNIMIFN
jgi:hypothetical protein